MYFYKLFSGDYEGGSDTVFYSDNKYTQEEFEDIVFDLYKESCIELIKSNPIELCYMHNFDFDEIIWDYKQNFMKKMESKGFYHLSKKLTAYMFFDLTGDKFFTKVYTDIDDTYDKRAAEIIDNLEIDESCWDNNCPIWDDDEDEKQYVREQCMMHYRKGKRIKNKTCDNCLFSKAYCNDNKNGCKLWEWDGKNE